MTKIAYLDCPTGIAGDMCLGALVHAGVPLPYLVEQLARLGIANEYQLWSELVDRNGQQATKVHVDLPQTDRTEASNPQPIASVQPLSESAIISHSHSHSDLDSHPHPHSHSDLDSHPHPHPHPHPDSPDHTLNSSPHPDSSPDSHPDFHPHHGVRHLPEIEQLILTAGLPLQATSWSLAIFRQLAAAEGAVHGVPPEQVHFHEVGATDAIVDIVGTCLGLDWLKIDALYCSPLPTGGGTIRVAHGLLPVPTPAVLKLYQMRQVPLYSNGIQRELVTPTGAAIATTLATAFGAVPPMVLQCIGLGAGSCTLPLPNILRLWIGEKIEPGVEMGQERQVGEVRQGILQSLAMPSLPTPQPAASTRQMQNCPLPAQPSDLQTIALLETQIDDLNPQVIGYVFDRLFAAGALDVFTQAIAMKKSRPGVLLSVVCYPEQLEACESIVFQETTTLGIRRSLQQRSILQRQIHSIQTDYGAVQVKVATQATDGKVINVQPEYEDCAQLARQTQLPWREIHRLALQAWYQAAQQG